MKALGCFIFLFSELFGGGKGVLNQMVLSGYKTAKFDKEEGRIILSKKQPLEACQIVIVYLLLTNESSKAWSKYLLSRERSIVSY